MLTALTKKSMLKFDYLCKDFNKNMGSGVNDTLFAATVGFFDGVHTGHRYLLRQLSDLASEHNLQSMAVTFPEHPRLVLQQDYRPLLLSTPEDKIRLLSQKPIDVCTPLHFTRQLSEMTALQFMKEILHDQLGIRVLLMGHDHHFGHDGVRDIEDYRRIGTEAGLQVFKADALIYKDEPVSSSRIRRMLSVGNVREAAAMLGYNYSMTGTVVHGFQNGRKIGFPTANLGPHNPFLQIPENGVYAAIATIQGESFMSMVNIGFRPTFSGTTQRTIEANLFDFDRDIYGQELTLEFIDYIRPEQRFGSPQLLAEQLVHDRLQIRQLLSEK